MSILDIGRGSGAGAVAGGAEADALPEKAMQKIDDALAWLSQAKQASRKAYQSTSAGQAATVLKVQLKNNLEQLLQHQAFLEEVKMSGTGDITAVATQLQSLTQGLVQVQELIRGLAAMR